MTIAKQQRRYSNTTVMDFFKSHFDGKIEISKYPTGLQGNMFHNSLLDFQAYVSTGKGGPGSLSGFMSPYMRQRPLMH